MEFIEIWRHLGIDLVFELARADEQNASEEKGSFGDKLINERINSSRHCECNYVFLVHYLRRKRQGNMIK